MSDAPNRRPARFLWDFSSLAAGQLISMLLGFVGFAYLARALPTESYGFVEYAVGLAGLAAIVIEGGLGPVGAMGIARDRSRAGELAGGILTARFLLALLLAPLVGLSTQLTGHGWPIGLLVWLYAVSLFAVPFKQDWLLQGLERMTYVAPAQALRSGVFALCVFSIVRGSDDLLRVGGAEIVAAFAAAVYYLVAQRVAGVPLRVHARMLRAWPLIRAGAAVGASNMVWTFMLYAPIFLVTNLAGAGQAAWLGSAQRIVYSLVSFSALYFFNLYPTIARGLHGDRGEWQRLIERSYRLVAWGSLGVALLLTLTSEAVVTLAFGQAFTVAAPVFSIYIWLFPVRLLSGHARWALVAGGRQGYLLLSEFLGTVSLMALGIGLIPRFGAVGAATSVVAANVVGWLSAHAFATRHVGRLPGIQQTALPAVSALSSGVLAQTLGDSLAVSVIIGAGVFGTCLRLAAPGLLDDARRLAYVERSKAD